MISMLRGIIYHKDNNLMVLDVNGVGYEIFTSSNTIANSPSVGEEFTIQTITHVREDHIHLFGFENEIEKEWFTILTTVSGVGAKMGLALLSAIPANNIAQIIANGDKKTLTLADGVGPKLAARIITELQDKASKMTFGETETDAVTTNTASIPNQDNQIANDATSALVNLGYAQSDAIKVVSIQLQETPDASLSQLIRSGLAALNG